MPSSDASITGRVVLCIDDEAACLQLYQEILESAGYRVVVFTDGPSGVRYLASANADVAVLDYSLPRMTGAEIARSIRAITPAMPIIMISSAPECPDDAKELIDLYMVKAQDDIHGLPRSIEMLLVADVA